MIENNIFFKPFRTTRGAIPFDRITTADYEPAINQGIKEHDAEVNAIADNDAEATFENTIVALERAGIKNNSRCRSGACGFCRTELREGDVFVAPEGDGRRRADKQFGYIHACSTWPLSDCTIRIPIL